MPLYLIFLKLCLGAHSHNHWNPPPNGLPAPRPLTEQPKTLLFTPPTPRLIVVTPYCYWCQLSTSCFVVVVGFFFDTTKIVNCSCQQQIALRNK